MHGRNQRGSDHLQSPYARTPRANRRQQIPETPGSIFSKVKRMFSPSVWINETSPEGEQDDDTTVAEDVTTTSVMQDPSSLLNKNQASQSQFSTPLNPFAEFRRLQNDQQASSDSPNQTLAKFFAQKGNQPLSAIEIEGVKALLSKTNSPETSINLSKPEEDDDEDDEDDSEMTNNISINESLLQHDSKRITSATPSFKATYNNKTTYVDVRSRSNTPEPSSHRKKIYDFSGFPSPYRTSRLKSSFSISDLKKETGMETEEDHSNVEGTNKLSNTASALLSFIENSNESNEKNTKSSTTNSKDNKFIDFSNPYAINRKSKKPSSILVKKSELSASERLEESLNKEELKEEKPQHDQPSTNTASTSFLPQKQTGLETVNKYKPAKSSSLRESITINDDDQSMEQSNSNNNIQDISITEPPTKSLSLLSHPPIVESTPSLNGSKSFSFTAPPSDETKPSLGFTLAPSSFTFTTLTKPSAEISLSNTNTVSTPLFTTNSISTASSSNQPDEQMDDVPLFTFPDAIRSTFSTDDIDESKVRQYEALFTF